jgi:hypothetical protein
MRINESGSFVNKVESTRLGEVPSSPIVPSPTPSPNPVPGQTTYQMWLSAPAGPNMNVNVDSTLRILCPAMNATIARVLGYFNLNFAAVMTSTAQDGCSVVTPLPSAQTFVRVAYKFYFALYPAQWSLVSETLDSAGAIKAGHVMCNSIIYWQSYTSPAVNTREPATSTSNPTWLDPVAGKTVCYTDAFAAPLP